MSRFQTLSLLYLVAYLFQAVTAIGVGALATSGTLSTSVIVAAATPADRCIFVVVLLTISTCVAPQAASAVNA